MELLEQPPEASPGPSARAGAGGGVQGAGSSCSPGLGFSGSRDPGGRHRADPASWGTGRQVAALDLSF